MIPLHELRSRPTRHLYNFTLPIPGLCVFIQLLNPIAAFRGQSLGDIKRELGEINHDFLENMAAKYSGNDELSLLQANDMQGKVLILFSAS